MLSPAEVASIAVKALEDKKAKDVKVLKITEQTVLADYFVICSGSSNTQIKALSESVEEAMKNVGELPDHIEGHREGTWVLSDYGCVIVHVFSDEAREFYDLERLWSDAEEIDISGILTKE